MPEGPRPSRPRRRGICAAVAALLGAATASADEPPPRSEYRFFAGARHEGELLTADALAAGRLALRGVDLGTEALERGSPASPLAVALRAGVFVAVDLPILSYTLVVPHEVFGHAARYRELGGSAVVHLDLPLPYSLKADHYVVRRPTRPLYAGEESLGFLGGLQAQEASQRMLALTVFRTDVLRRGDAMIYASTSLTHVAQTLAGRDLENAAMLVRREYAGDPASYRDAVRTALVLDLVDPLLVASLLRAAYGYGVRGERAARAPSLRLGGARWLATSRTLAVPWGAEHQLHVLAAWPWATFDVGVRSGFGERGSLGIEAAVWDVRALEIMRLGAELAAWTQPRISSYAELGPPPIILGLGAPGRAPDESRLGGAARVLFEVHQAAWLLGTRLGYKTVGLWGERELAAGFDVAMTFGLKLD